MRIRIKQLLICAVGCTLASQAFSANSASESQLNAHTSVRAVVAKDIAGDYRSNARGFRWEAEDTAEAMDPSHAAKTENAGFRWETSEAMSASAADAARANARGVRPAVAESTGFRWGIRSTAEQQGFRWGIRSAAEQQGFRWGIRSTADQQGFRWGIRSTADQQGFRWGIRSAAEQQGFRWGIRSTAGQQGFRWGIR